MSRSKNHFEIMVPHTEVVYTYIEGETMCVNHTKKKSYATPFTHNNKKMLCFLKILIKNQILKFAVFNFLLCMNCFIEVQSHLEKKTR